MISNGKYLSVIVIFAQKVNNCLIPIIYNFSCIYFHTVMRRFRLLIVRYFNFNTSFVNDNDWSKFFSSLKKKWPRWLIIQKSSTNGVSTSLDDVGNSFFRVFLFCQSSCASSITTGGVMHKVPRRAVNGSPVRL